MPATADGPGFEPVACPLCDGRHFREVAEIIRFDPPFRMVRCRDCSLLYMSPRPGADALSRLYGGEYYGGEAPEDYVDDRTQEPQVHVRAAGRLARVDRLLRRDGVPSRRLVELGSSWGTFLDEARAQGWETIGCETSEESGGWARRERGLHVRDTDLADAGLPPASVDLVTGSEVVEHLTDPRRTLRAAFDVLAPRGVALFSTANEKSVARMLRGSSWRYYLPGHVVIWSATTLPRLLRQMGFVEVTVTAGDERGFANFLAFRRAAGGGSIPGWWLKRLRLGPWTLGAGMIVTGRKPGRR